MSIDIRTNAGSITVNIKIDSGLDAIGLENLIRVLAETRAAMQPPVPLEMRDLANHPVLRENTTTMAADPPTADGVVAIHLRNSGMGWLSWRLQASQCRDLRDFLNGYFPQGRDDATVGMKNPAH